MKIGVTGWSRRWTLGKGGFLGEVTLEAVPPERLDLTVYGERCAFVNNLFVHPLRRGKGWADQLLSTTTDYADKHGLTLVLWTLPYGDIPGASNRALKRLYERHGFVRLGKRSDDMVRPCSSR